MALSYPALKTELTTDPVALGYAPFWAGGADNALVAILQWLRDGVTACPTNGVVGAAISVKRPDLRTAELLEAIDVLDFVTTASNLQSAYFQAVVQAPSLRLLNDDGTDTRTYTNVKQALGNTRGSQTRLAALAVRAGSRVEALFGAGTVLGLPDIARARAS